MAALNKSLLAKFSNLFKSNSLLDISKTIVCGNTVLSCLGENSNDNISYADLNKKFDAKLNDPKVTDDTLLKGLLRLNEEEIARIPLSMWADIFESVPFQALEKTKMQSFQNKINRVWPFTDLAIKCAEAEDVVLNAQHIRRMIKSSRHTAQNEKKYLQAVDDKVKEFKSEFDPDFLKNANKNTGKHYSSAWSSKKDVIDQMRQSDIAAFGREKGSTMAAEREAAIKSAGKANREAVTAYYMNAHDKTRLAALAAFGKSESEFPDMFLAKNVDGSDKNNPHFIPSLVGTMAVSFGVSAAMPIALRVAAPLLANIPVAGRIIGPLMAGTWIVGSAIKESARARKIAHSQNRKVTHREVANIVINAVTHAAPYAVMMAVPFGTLGRSMVSAGTMALKTFGTDILRRKAELPVGQNLSLKDYAKSLGTSTARALAMAIGSLAGGFTAGKVINGITALTADRAASATATATTTETSESMQNNTVSQEDPSRVKNYDEYARPNLESTTGTHNDLGQHNSNNTTNAEPKLSRSTITADENSLRTLREHKFDLTDHARSTANPDHDRMFQLDRGANRYTQNDWYDKAGYDRAINVLREAGVADADGALRNLAGANQFVGGEYGTELKNLLDGKLTTNTINQILKADAILDETADLIRGGVETKPVFNHDAPAFENIKVKLPDTIGELTLPEVEPVVETIEPVVEPVIEPVPEIIPETTKVTLPDTVGELTLPEAEPVFETIEPIVETKPVEVVTPASIPLPNHDTGAAVDQFNSGNLPTREWANDPVNILQDDSLLADQQDKLSSFIPGHAWRDYSGTAQTTDFGSNL